MVNILWRKLLMKKLLILGVVIMLMLPLTSCAGNGNAESATIGITPDEIGGASTTTGTHSVNQLLLGTLALEGTDLAVNPDMASQLLPLWQAARALYTSGTSAAQEQEAILNQITEVMTAEQLEAIEAMDLGSEGTAQVMRETLGEAFPEGFPFGGRMEGFPADGELPEGFPDPPGGMAEGLRGLRPEQGFGAGPGLGEGSGEGFGQGMGQGLSPEAQATLQAERGGRGNRLANPFLFDFIIELLQERAQEG
jgi:hypothetical protein